MLAGLREQLVPLVAAIAGSPRRPDLSIVSGSFPTAAQEAFGRAAGSAIGFDFDRGRLDVTAHPFCTTLGPHNCRITTHFDEHFFNAAFFSILHEAGHGLYEQGLPAEHYGLPLGEAVSLGIHESQSRMWENMVGRSHAFWEHFFPEAQRRFPAALGGVALDAFYFALNEVRPSLVRIEADEATYNLHILVRFELEQALLDAQLAPADLPGAWNEKYRKYLGIQPPNDAQGVLQERPLERRPGRLFSHLHAGQPLRGPVLRPGRCRTRRSVGAVRPGRVPALAALAGGKNPLPRAALHGGRTGPARHRPAA